MSEQFGKYELIRRIGIGGMAEVYHARTYGAESFVKEVVIKRILPAFSEDPDFVTMFINEARIAAQLHHANVVQIFDFDAIEGIYYIAMEWIDGPDLRKVQFASRRRDRPIPISLVVHVGVEVLKGLHYAHTKTVSGVPLGLVHRDISPHNLLLSFAGGVKITDFGIAKVAALASATRTGIIKGKLAYMAPEQACGESIDCRTDLYALGVILWELFAGRRLYSEAGSESELIAAVREGRAADLDSLRPDLPEGLGSVVMQLKAPDPSDRFSTAAEALNSLGRFVQPGDGLSVSAYLKELLPAEAERDQRGRTKIATPEPKPILAPPDAPTHTIDESRVSYASSDSTNRAASSMSSTTDGSTLALAETSVAPSVSTPPTSGVEASANRRVLSRDQSTRSVGAYVVYAAAFAVAAILSAAWFSRSTDSGSKMWTTLAVEVPDGGSVVIDGVPIKRGHDFIVQAELGTSLDLQAVVSGRQTNKRVVVGEQGRVILGRQGQGARTSESDSPEEAENTGALQDQGIVSRNDGGLFQQPDARAEHVVHKVDAVSRRPISPAYGRVRIAAFPWAHVSIDGRRVGETPIRRSLRAGRHRIVLRNPELGMKLIRHIVVRARETTKVTIDWERKDPLRK